MGKEGGENFFYGQAGFFCPRAKLNTITILGSWCGWGENFLPGLKVCRGSYDINGIRFSRIRPPLGYMLCFW